MKCRRLIRLATAWLACMLLMVATGCAPSRARSIDSSYSPLLAAWERGVAGRDLSAPTALRNALEMPGPLFGRDDLTAGRFAYEMGSGGASDVVMWRLVSGADPFEEESWWEHVCANVQVEGAHLKPQPTGCHPGVPDDPPSNALPNEVEHPPSQHPWARPASGDLTFACEPESVEVVIDQLQASGAKDSARLSVRNYGTSSCDLLGTPGIRFQNERESRVVSLGGGTGAVRLKPGQSSTATMSWAPLSEPPGPQQRVDVTLGGIDPIRAQFGYGATSDPLRFPSGTGRVGAWSPPSESAALGDVSRVSAVVAPTCGAQRVSAALAPVDQEEEPASDSRVHAEIRITNHSFLPCRVNQISVMDLSPSGQVVFSEISERVILPGEEYAAKISWEPASAPGSPTVWTVDFDGGGGPVSLDQQEEFIPTMASQIEIEG
ncbi:DUF4232 domain-containing protein [Kocuria rhizophila]|uniref:DUF4232 domain-containing protein n=2 Tax=Kocuria rhizophila TaxID=72000 RepID=UPI002966FC24|nr:DUF4232 domain-containing protein [Kocuria rhizophila]